MSEDGTVAANTPPKTVPEEDIEEARVRKAVERALLGEQTPLRIDRYAVLSKLGQGGMGVVYSAFDEELDRRVAIKVLASDEKPSATQRLRLEAQAMARLSHPNVVQVYGVGTWEQRVYLAMEFIRGQTLRAWLKESKPKWPEVIEVFRQAGEGLAAAHEVGIVHRDFKPDNVMIDDKGRPRVLDFGLARADDSDNIDTGRSEALGASASWSGSGPRPTITRTGAVMGTPAYMSPEQHTGKPTDARTDQFSFCVALYEGLYGGVPPFAGDKRSSLASSVTDGKIRDPPRDTPVPNWVWKVVLRGLQPRPDDRWPSMAALLEALSRDPARARRRWIIGAAMLGVGGGLLGLQSLDRASRVSECEDEGASISAVWNEDRRAAVEQGILRTGAPYAQTSWKQVERSLDAYAAQWSDMRSDVCMRVDVHGTWTQQRREVARECFDERAAGMQALVDVLSQGEEGMLEDAARAASSLASAHACADERALDRRPSLPAAPEVRGRVLEARKELARARALGMTGNHELSRTVAQGVLAASESTDYLPLRAEAIAVIGQTHLDQAQFELAVARLSEAYFLSEDAGMEALSAATATTLVTAVGYRLADHDGGLVWGRHARLHLKRLDAEESIGRAQLDNNLGLLHWRQGENVQAIEQHHQALAVREKVLGEVHPLVGESLHNLGLVELDNGEFEAAATHLARSYEILETSLGSSHPRIAASLNAQGKVALLRGNYDEARQHFSRALEIGRKALGDAHHRVAHSLHHLGVVHLELGNFAEAREHLEEALTTREGLYEKSPDHPDLAQTLRAVGRLELVNGEHRAAQRHLERAAEVFSRRDTQQARVEQANTNFLLARVLWDAPPEAGRDRDRARSLAEDASTTLSDAGDHAGRGQVERWLDGLETTDSPD